MHNQNIQDISPQITSLYFYFQDQIYITFTILFIFSSIIKLFYFLQELIAYLINILLPAEKDFNICKQLFGTFTRRRD